MADEQPIKKRNIEKLVRWISAIIGVVVIIGLFLYKYYNPEANLAWLVVIGIIFIIICSFLFFGFSLFNKKEKVLENKVVMTKEEGEKYAEELIEKNYFDTWEQIDYSKVENHGKSGNQKILVVQGVGKLGQWDNQVYSVAINLHTPYIDNTVALDITQPHLNSIIKKTATNPEESPHKKVTEEENPLLGTRRKIVEDVVKKEEKPEEKKEAELK